ncbi:UNVERIFIED_CONTAM: hypothetical protein GTU68_015249 [Idotea baltica]|nr:hypothetical protein [Idotea baltica]
MEEQKVIISEDRFRLTIRRLCIQIIETYELDAGLCIIGIQPRGILLAERIRQTLNELEPNFKFDYGFLDITFYRDDFGRRDEPIQPNRTKIDFIIENRPVILIDDVLYTGRTIQASMGAIQGFGRPSAVELMVLVDRRFNRHVPIQADYIGLQIDALDESYVRVEWSEDPLSTKVLMYSSKHKTK